MRSIRVRAIPRSGVGVEALRGATTLEQQTLPAVIIASFAGLAIIQVILTW